MRKRKDSHDASPVGDTNILFVPGSSADPSASGVDALMGMIDEAGAPPQAPPPPEVPSSDALAGAASSSPCASLGVAVPAGSVAAGVAEAGAGPSTSAE